MSPLGRHLGGQTRSQFPIDAEPTFVPFRAQHLLHYPRGYYGAVDASPSTSWIAAKDNLPPTGASPLTGALSTFSSTSFGAAGSTPLLTSSLKSISGSPSSASQSESQISSASSTISKGLAHVSPARLAGIGIGFVVLLVLLLFMGLFIRRRRRTRQGTVFEVVISSRCSWTEAGMASTESVREVLVRDRSRISMDSICYPVVAVLRSTTSLRRAGSIGLLRRAGSIDIGAAPVTAVGTPISSAPESTPCKRHPDVQFLREVRRRAESECGGQGPLPLSYTVSPTSGPLNGEGASTRAGSNWREGHRVWHSAPVSLGAFARTRLSMVPASDVEESKQGKRRENGSGEFPSGRANRSSSDLTNLTIDSSLRLWLSFCRED